VPNAPTLTGTHIIQDGKPGVLASDVSVFTRKEEDMLQRVRSHLWQAGRREVTTPGPTCADRAVTACSRPRARGPAFVALAVAAGIVGGVPQEAAADTTLSSCTAADFDAAAAAGGTVHFAVDCFNLAFDKTIVVAGGTTLDIEADGHTVTFNGGAARRLFIVDGALTVRGVRMTGGGVTGANGANGAAGAAGVDGSAGTNGLSGGVGVPGQPGGKGGNATNATAGKAGKAGNAARGGAVLIDATGNATFDHVTFNGNVVTGGNGGSGGFGGRGGNGGNGGNGGTTAVAPTAALTDEPPVIPAVRQGLDLGPACQQCGGMMQRTGSCYTCSSCGFNTGCG
jgi:hypothetical protein